MATATALCGLGVPGEWALQLGQEQATIAGVGTTQTGAAILKYQCVELTTGSGQTAFILTEQGLANETYVVNSSATAALVYPPSGHYMNGTQNGSFSVAQWKPCTFIEYKKSYWAAQLSA